MELGCCVNICKTRQKKVEGQVAGGRFNVKRDVGVWMSTMLMTKRLGLSVMSTDVTGCGSLLWGVKCWGGVVAATVFGKVCESVYCTHLCSTGKSLERVSFIHCSRGCFTYGSNRQRYVLV